MVTLVANLVEFEDIANNIGSPGMHLFDVRWYLDGRDGYPTFLERHIKSAAFLDIDECLSNHRSADPKAGRHPLPDPKTFESVLSSFGAAKDHLLVFYDDQAGSIAARGWWMASAMGYNAALLNGGLTSAPDDLTESGPNGPKPLTRLPYVSQDEWDPKLVISEHELKTKIAKDAVILLDARSKERYLGINEAIDPRAGHIPSAVSAFWRQNIDRKNRFKHPGEIAKNFNKLGIENTTHKDVVSSCGSGITACHNIFALLYSLGITARLFPPSFSGWCRSPENKVDK